MKRTTRDHDVRGCGRARARDQPLPGPGASPSTSQAARRSPSRAVHRRSASSRRGPEVRRRPPPSRSQGEACSEAPRHGTALSGRAGRVVRHHPVRLQFPASITSVVDCAPARQLRRQPDAPRVGGHVLDAGGPGSTTRRRPRTRPAGCGAGRRVRTRRRGARRRVAGPRGPDSRADFRGEGPGR